MSCDSGVDVPGFFDPMSEAWQALMGQIGQAIGAFSTGVTKYADEAFREDLETFENRLKKSVDLLAKNAQEAADKARVWANEMATKGPIAEAYAQKVAQE